MSSKPKPKFYVVWCGTEPGVYTTWEECQARVLGVPGAKYKAFPTREEAEAAFAAKPAQAVAAKEKDATDPRRPAGAAPSGTASTGKAHRSDALPPNPPDDRHDTVLPLPPEVTADAWAVDAACSGNPGAMEYRGVDLATGAEIFHLGPIKGTNNIGEFLAIVHALALLQRSGLHKALYSDSRNALSWIRARKCRTKLPLDATTQPVHDLILRAERWLQTHDISSTPIFKWETERWGEIPADFGRKG